MKFSDLLGFKKEIFFDGAVQIDWFYQEDKSDIVARNFMFHGKEYHGVNENKTSGKLTDTVQFVENISDKINSGEGTNPFTLAIAGYGTGKSHLAITLAELLSGPNFHEATYNAILKNIERIDAQQANVIKANTQGNSLVLVLNGMRDFNLHYELLRSAQKSLQLYGCSIAKLKKIDRTLEIAERFFDRNGHTAIDLFEKYAAQYGYALQGEALIKAIGLELGDKQRAFDTINAVYNDINGNVIRWDEGVSATAILNALLEEYCGEDGEFDNIVIIFDEFGRYLEYASDSSTVQSGDSALQQIFESAQNADGAIQIINFIQSDIKSYLQRIDKTSNISRYIGRYDASDKYYLSSNLETIFANLVERKDPDNYQKIIKLWISKQENNWQDIFNSISKWLTVKGLWTEYSLFKKVAVEGIFPLHPLSTYMLSQLSDYLQNRSSLTLVSTYFDRFADDEITGAGSLPYVYPEELLKGDLYTEMLDAEEKGRQSSQHCIKFNNIKRKFQDKLSEKAFKVLRSNLVLRILRFRTNSYEDAIKALAMCSGLDIKEIRTELETLDNQYAVLAFDEHAGCFDFLEDSKGAYDYNIFFKRLRALTNFDTSVLENSAIREMAEVIENQVTNFSVLKHIKTNEWTFEQEMFPVEELSENLIDKRIEEWKLATSPEKAKGKLIWLYANKDSDISYIEAAQELSKKLEGKPIVLMLLDDADDKLKELLIDYTVLNKVSEVDRMKYIRYYNDATSKVESAIKNVFYQLRGERKVITPEAVVQSTQRLSAFLTKIFNDLYSKAIPFDFGGLDLKNKAKAKEAFASIVKLLLSGAPLENSIKALPIPIRNNFEATLFNRGIGSWRCVSANFQITTPGNLFVMDVYSEIQAELDDKGEVSYKTLYEKFVKPPYGMNNYSVLYLLAVVIANLQYCLRLEYAGEMYKAGLWQEKIFLYKKNSTSVSDVNNRVLLETVLHKVNPEGVNAAFINLFAKINNNTDPLLVDSLDQTLDRLIKSESIPEELEAQYQLCKHHLSEGKQVMMEWERKYGSVQDSYKLFVTNKDVPAGLRAAEQLESSSLFSMFYGSSYSVPSSYENRIEKISSEVRSKIEPEIAPWIETLMCRSVADINNYKSYVKRMKDTLKGLGYLKEVELLEKKCKQQTSNQEMLIEKQAVNVDVYNYIKECKFDQYIPYTQYKAWMDRGKKLVERIKKCKDYLNNTDELISKVDSVLQKCEQQVEVVDDFANMIYDELDVMANINDVERIITNIQELYSKGMDVEDLTDYKELEADLKNLQDTLENMFSLKEDRDAFVDFVVKAEAYYDNNDSISDVFKNTVSEIKKSLEARDLQWKGNFLQVSLTEQRDMVTWLKKTEILPKYLSPETIALYNSQKNTVEEAMSKFAIDDVVFRFRRLTDEQRKKCLGILAEL